MRRIDRGVVLGLYRHDPDRNLLEAALTLGVCGVDTAYNYRGFAAHRMLADAAGDLLDEFTVSTKVGFFPGPSGNVQHSLRPNLLRTAIDQSAHDLRRVPEVVLLHNPERTLADLSRDQARDRLTDACGALSDAVASGLARAWGIATWDPRPLADIVDAMQLGARPTVLLIRAGLTVPDQILVAAETLAAKLDIAFTGRWGMSPFAGSMSQDVWRTTDLTAFMDASDQRPTIAAAFRLAYELPQVSRLVVGTADPTHLAQLVAATDLATVDHAIDRYRELIRADAV